MSFIRSIVPILFFFALICSISSAQDFKKGEIYNGFKLLEKRFVKEVNAECLYFEHVKSGARLFKIAADDPNKTFSIAFKTDPESDCGTPHIMEHSVLNGSKNFPVKSPFDVLSKGSLNTFINAFTGDDLTCYPFASMNDKDYFNLMRVYMDAVFNPLIYSEPRILKQEGWHYEMEKVDGPIAYKGVVYNEMKGAYSNPTRELGHQINQNLFPDNGYRFTAGGYPTAIPKLSFDMFLNFHKKYYHPVNSHILLYGNGDLNKELTFIDKEYLSKYNKAERPVTFPLQKPFASPKEVTGKYPVTEGSKTEDQTYLTLSIVAGLNIDRALVMSMNILADVLVNQEAAPIRLALQKAGIGKDVSASVDELRQNVFQITVQNANAADKDRFREIVYTTLKEVSEKGFDKKAIEGTISRTEFQLREGNDAQKGITYNFQILPGWFFADDPYLTLEWEKPLAKVKTALETNYLESIIKNYLINNPHSLLLALEPKPGLDKEINAQTEKELSEYSTSLTEDAKETLVKDTEALIEYQKREDTPEALATMPLLDRKDINPKAAWYSVDEQKVDGVPVLHHEEFTNDVVYTRFMFDARVLPTELIPYAALLTEVLGSQNTEKYSYGDLDNELNINTGGFNSFINTYLEKQNDSDMLPKFIVNTRAMNKKMNKMFGLAGEIINKTRYTDVDRLKEIIARYQSRIDAQVKNNGFGFTRTRVNSYFNNAGMLGEITGGIEFYWFLTDLSNNFDAKANEIIEKLSKTASLLFKKENLIAAVTCSKNDLSGYLEGLTSFAKTLPSGKVVLNDWKFNLEKKNEGFLTASKVQYVIKGYNFKNLGYDWSGKMYVLSQILSTDWLQTRIRVIGGAYGGFSAFAPNGTALFMSYRDPNLKESLDNYDAIPDYLDKLEINDKDMTRYLIGTIAQMDIPLTPSQRGNTAVQYYFQKTTPEDIQKDRDAILSTTLQDVKGMKKMVADVLNQNTFCVYGNETKLQSQKEIFGKLEKISK